MAARCIASTKRGTDCGRSATILDPQRGGMVCAAHAPRPDKRFLKLGNLVVNPDQIVYVDFAAQGGGWVEVVFAPGPGRETLSRCFPGDSEEAQTLLRWLEEDISSKK